MVKKSVPLLSDVTEAVTLSPFMAPLPPGAMLHASKTKGCRMLVTVQSVALMAPLLGDMAPPGQARTAVGSDAETCMEGQ